MKFKTYTGITWSVLELTGVLEDEDSRVYYEKFKKHLALHPFHLTNLTAALNEILSSKLNFYDAELKGFLLAYKNPKLLTPLGEIVYDTCFIHVDIEADFYVFRPEVGCSLKGVVNKKGFNHIGVLVHKAFNVSIPKPDREEDWPGDDLEIGEEVHFVVTNLDITTKLPFIRGALNADDYLRGCKLTPGKQNKRKSTNNRSQNSIDNTVDKISESSSKETNHTFFATDSEHSSDEDAVQVKKEHLVHQKQKKKLKQEVEISHDEKKKEDKKRTKKSKQVNESMYNVTKIETMDEQGIDDVSLNSNFVANRDLEKLKKQSKKKYSNIKLEQSASDLESTYESKVKPKKKSRSNRESVDEISNIKLEQSSITSDWESASESRVKSKKKSSKSNTESIDEIGNIKLEQSSITSDWESASESRVKSKKKSSKPNRETIDEIGNIKLEQSSITSDWESASESKVKSKKKSSKSNRESIDGISNIKLEQSSITSDWESASESRVKSKKKPKSNRESIDEIGNIKLEQSSITSDWESASESRVKSKKKSSKSNRESIDEISNIKLEQLSIPSDLEQDAVDSLSRSEIKLKKKSNKHDKESIDRISDIKLEEASMTSDLENMSESKVKSKKKSSKSNRASLDKINNIKLEQDSVQIAEESVLQNKQKSKKRLDNSDKEFVDRISNIKLEQSENSDLEKVTEETEGKIRSKKTSNKLSNNESVDRISNIKVEQFSDFEQTGEEIVVDNTVWSRKISNKLIDAGHEEENIQIKLEKSSVNSDVEQVVEETRSKKKALKRKPVDEDNNSADDFTANKYIKCTSTTDAINDVQESPSKKKSRKRKHSVKSEISENGIDNTNPEVSPRRRSKKNSLSDSESVIHVAKVETEMLISDSENTQNEDLETTVSRVSEGGEDKVEKKEKRHSEEIVFDPSRIKTEPIFEFEDVIKAEKLDDGYGDDRIGNISQNNTGSPSKVVSPKKRRKSRLHNDLNDDEGAKDTDAETYGAKITKGRILTNHVAVDENDLETQHVKSERKQSRNSPTKHSSKSNKSEMEIDFENVKIKTEKVTS